MKRLSPSLFSLGAALMAGAGIGAGYAGTVTGSMVLLVIALLCALICALLRAISSQRAICARFDALLSDFRPTAPANDDRGRL